MPPPSPREMQQQLYRLSCAAVEHARRPPAPAMVVPRLLIFGVDGTLCAPQDPRRLMPHVVEVLGCYPLRAAGRGEMAVGIVSNQEAVGRGEISPDTCEQELWELLYRVLGVRPADLFFAHRVAPGKASSEPPLTLLFCTGRAPDNLMRLPNPGMLDLALERHDVAPAEALMVGVHPDEATAAYLAGVPFLGAWDFFGWPDPPRPLLHAHRCDVCGRYLTLQCQCLDRYRYGLCETCEREG